MLIERPITENLKFENLILYDKNGILDGRIIKYTLSKEPEKDANHGGEILDIINTEMTTLEIDGRYGIPCVMTYTIMCGTLGTTPYNTYTGVHIANWECYSLSENLYMITSLECSGGGNIEGTGTIGTGSSGGNSGTGSNGGSGAGTIPSIPTSPISPFGSHETVVNNPCENLNNNSNRNVFREKFKDLNSNSKFSRNGETGYFESKDANNNRVFTYKQPYPGSHTVKITSGTFSFMHVHNDETEIEQEDGSVFIGKSVKMISPADINVFISNCQNTANSNNIANSDTYGIMISREGIFAITMLQSEPNPSQIDNFNDMNKDFDRLQKKS